MNNNDIKPQICSLFNKLSLAKTALSTIRNDLKQLNEYHAEGINDIHSALESWKNEPYSPIPQTSATAEIVDTVHMKPIGVVTTCFTQKRSTPRQPCICGQSRGKLTLFNTVYTNPDHALQGLQEFSHMWILFYFHKINSTHTRAKVAPPRLDGKRTGVFSTRCPHRPCPIGLSLVHIDRVDGTSVYFSGVDMLNGTPVLDIKPYIPLYDNPNFSHESGYKSATLIHSASDYNEYVENPDECIDPAVDLREAPDGEERSSVENSTSEVSSPNQRVKVPDWITNPIVYEVAVTFNDKAIANLEDIKESIEHSEQTDGDVGVDDIKKMISDVLSQDPRSVYVRERYSNQFYTFLIGKYHVSCKFDDNNHAVQVYRINRASSLDDWRNPINERC